MSALVRRNLPFIRLLISTNTKQQKALFNTITREQVKSIIEITYNIINLGIRVSPADRTKLIRHVTLLKDIGIKKQSIKKKTVLIKSKGKIIISMLKAVINTIAKIV